MIRGRKALLQVRRRRAHRVRARIFGTKEKPRLSVFRSNTYTYAQLIDDADRKTIASVSSREMKDKKGTKQDGAKFVGKSIAEKAKKAGIETAVFDRGPYQYHGRVKTLVEAAREGGLQI